MPELSSTMHSAETLSPSPHQSPKDPATTQYHAQLYSGQKQLQKRQQQKQQQQKQQQQQQQVHHQDGQTQPTSAVKKPSALPVRHFNALAFEPPNLYRSALKLTAEIMIHSWWSSVVEILTGPSSFHATRAVLSVPQDSNDPWTEPWGLKAVYNKPPKEEKGRDKGPAVVDPSHADYFVHNHDDHEAATHAKHIPWCFNNLQPFESESEPLINNPSVQRILLRNTTVVLSREYRQHSSRGATTARRLLKSFSPDDSHDMFKRALLEQTEKTSRKLNGWSPPMITTPCLHKLEEGGAAGLFTESEILVDAAKADSEEEEHGKDISDFDTFLHDYDEYEQQQPSPWSQSPAPSPAMMDPDINPFFQSPPDIDDDAFNPVSPATYDTSSIPYPLPISNVHSVVHVPLFHPLDIEATPSAANHHPSSRLHSNPMPIAILSFLSPIVPFPPVLLQSLSSLAPFIATSFSNAFYVSSQPTICCSRPVHRQHSHRRPRPSSTLARAKTDPELDSTSTTPTATAADMSSFRSPKGYHAPNMIPSPYADKVSSGHETATRDPMTPDPERPSPLQPESPSTEALYASFAFPPDAAPSKPLGLSTAKAGNEAFATALPDLPASTLSPSSIAVLEGWAAISPTTGLPIQPSIPPASICYNKRCAGHYTHPEPKKSNSDEDCGCRKPDGTRTDNDVEPAPAQMNVKSRKQHRSRSRRKPCRSRPRPKDMLDDNGFHYHPSVSQKGTSKDDMDRYLVAPKSSLLRLVIDGIPIHVFTCSTATGQVTWVNNRILQYTGRAFQNHLGPGWLSHMHPDDQADCRKAWDIAFEQGNGFAGEYRLRRFDGVYRCFLWRIVPLRDLKGRIIHWFGTCTDVHDQHVAKESNLRQMEIENNERKYRLLAEAIPQIVFTFSPATGLTYANGKWENYSGQPFERTMGLGFISQVHPDDRQKLQLPDLTQHKTAGVTWHSEIRLLSGKGEYCWFLVKCISVDELDTGDVRWFGTCTDINDHKLLEHKLKEAHDAAQKSTESKTRFLSNMSHEIRTPLIGITGMLNFLLDTELTPEQMDYANTIQQSAESLLVVINDILDLSKVEAGMMKLEWEPFSLVMMIEDANELLSTLAIQKGLELSYWVDTDVPDVVIGDKVRLRQVLLNLIGNAIKFTTDGEIFTQCRLQSLDKEKSELVLLFEVVDTGTGFDADGEALMFKPFSQVDSSSTRKHGGSGLGLVISRQLIELHGGEMKCTSKKGKGSTFYFTVKFGITSTSTLPRPHTPQNETYNDPFFRTSTLPMHRAAAQSVSTPSEDPSFAPSPLAHSKKHSQTTDVSNPVELLQDALLNKAASMRLVPPPIRKMRTQSSTIRSIPESSAGVCDNMHPSMVNDASISSNLKVLELNKSAPSLISPSVGVILPPRTPTQGEPLRTLLISEWTYSRDTMIKHVKAILGMLGSQRDYQLDIAANHLDAIQFLASIERPPYDYILINLASEKEILSLTRAASTSLQHQEANVLVVTTPMQRSLIMDRAKDDDSVLPNNCGFVFKPLKRSKLNWYFGVRVNEAGEDGRRACAPDAPQRRAVTQKEIFRRMEEDVGGKGFRVLLVEDNPVNQKVLTRYLTRVGLEVDVANNGQQCVDMYFTHPHSYYSLILCDLFMPVKDGYEATREIREQEASLLEETAQKVPIVALSANVMSDVAEKCLDCGFSTYISKPVNFAILSDVIRGFLLPSK